jgi:hypothetical protein
MGFITDFLGKLQEKEARKLARDLYESVADSANSFKAIFPGKSESDYVKLALEERTGWKKINEQTYEYKKSEETKTVEILGSDTLLGAINKVAVIELQVAAAGLASKQKWNLVKVGLAEIERCSKENLPLPPTPEPPKTE